MSEDYRSTVQEIAQAMAPGWERRRAFLEDTAAPVREWLIRELAPRPGETVSSWRPAPATRGSRRPRPSVRPAG